MLAEKALLLWDVKAIPNDIQALDMDFFKNVNGIENVVVDWLPKVMNR